MGKTLNNIKYHHGEVQAGIAVFKMLQKGCIWLAGAQNLQTATYAYLIFYLFIYLLT